MRTLTEILAEHDAKPETQRKAARTRATRAAMTDAEKEAQSRDFHLKNGLTKQIADEWDRMQAGTATPESAEQARNVHDALREVEQRMRARWANAERRRRHEARQRASNIDVNMTAPKSPHARTRERSSSPSRRRERASPDGDDSGPSASRRVRRRSHSDDSSGASA